MSECISNCSTVSHHTLKNTLHTIPCSIQSNECAAFSEVAIPASKPVSKNPGQGWYLFSDGEFDKIALNFSWEREHEASIASLQGYYFSVIETDSTNFPYPNLEKYYCFDIKLQFNLHIFAKYYYDCYGTAPSEEIRPGKKFIVYVGSLPQPGPRLEQNYYKRTIKIPGCDDPRLSRVKDCVERNSMKLKATEYFCENRTAVIDYNLPKTFGSSATLILCYAETYRKSFTWCETESYIDHLPMSNSNYTLVVPDKFNITKNISMSIHSDRDLRQVAYMKFVCSKPTEEPAASGLNSDILIVIVVCVLLALIFMVVAFVLAKRKSVKKLCQSRRNHQMPEPPEKFEPNITNETIVTSKVIKNTRTVCITFVGDNEMHKEVLLAFASFLQNDLGFKVIFELWDQDNIYKDASTWIANTLRDSDKVIVVWSPKACEKWNKFSEGENTDQQDLFTPILKQVQKDLVFNKNQGKYFFAFFEYCSEADIPEKFRDIIYRHFRLMNQFKELYFRLLDIEMFQPGSYEKQDRVELQHYFEQINKFGLPLKNRIENMCNFVKKTPKWYKSEEQ
uniref:Interleukin-17 receptor A-like n=1 Tax=Phallusia mammillata TaxID=59560 RepID=A0A6F9DF36_9ASCI|nr:interleukin-17 receptor A-like [Phallusia mammillata]